MRIGVITHTTGGRGGIERVVESQTEGLRARGHDVELVQGPALGHGWLARAGASAGLAFARTGALRTCDVLLAALPARAARRATHRPAIRALPAPPDARGLSDRDPATAAAVQGLVGDRLVAGRCRPQRGTSRWRGCGALTRCGPRSRAALWHHGVDPAAGHRRVGLRPRAGRAVRCCSSAAPTSATKRLDVALDVAEATGPAPLHVVGNVTYRDPRGAGVTWRGFLSGAAR